MNESLKLTSTDISDWFMECDTDADSQKIPHVILNDKLMTEAIFGTVVPIKAEHSYSLTSDGDSMPDSPSDASKLAGRSTFQLSPRYNLGERGVTFLADAATDVGQVLTV
jgi:hypothetical protein